MLNDSRIDVAGNAVHLDACGESYRIGLDPGDMTCDFAVYCDVAPWTIADTEENQVGMGFVPVISLRPVGMRNVAKNVLAFDGGTKVYGADGLPICILRDDFEEDMALNMGQLLSIPCILVGIFFIGYACVKKLPARRTEPEKTNYRPLSKEQRAAQMQNEKKRK